MSEKINIYFIYIWKIKIFLFKKFKILIQYNSRKRKLKKNIMVLMIIFFQIKFYKDFLYFIYVVRNLVEKLF